MGCVGGQQELFLEAEVLLFLGFPVSEEGAGDLGGVLAGRAAELLGGDEHAVMVARERDQSGMALHDLTRGATVGGWIPWNSISQPA